VDNKQSISVINNWRGRATKSWTVLGPWGLVKVQVGTMGRHIKLIVGRWTSKPYKGQQTYNISKYTRDYIYGNKLRVALADDSKQIKRIESWFFKGLVVITKNCDLEGEMFMKGPTRIRKVAYGSRLNIKMCPCQYYGLP